MKVFISWSGRASHRVASYLRTWLPDLIQQVEPFLSEEDIRKGNRWGLDIARQLEATDIGIVCLTPENRTAPWLNFEAGALSKSMHEGRTFTLLLNGLAKGDAAGPLAQFQHTELEETDFFRLCQSINEALGPEGLPLRQLERAYERLWPELADALLADPPHNSAADTEEADTHPIDLEGGSDPDGLDALIRWMRTRAAERSAANPNRDLSGIRQEIVEAYVDTIVHRRYYTTLLVERTDANEGEVRTQVRAVLEEGGIAVSDVLAKPHGRGLKLGVFTAEPIAVETVEHVRHRLRDAGLTVTAFASSVSHF